jgi:hypothetical protein
MHKVYSILQRAGVANQVSLYRNANNSLAVLFRDARLADASPLRNEVMHAALAALTGKVNVIARVDGFYHALHVLPADSTGLEYRIAKSAL